MSFWTLSYNNTEKSLADWGVSNVIRRLVSQGLDDLSFKTDGLAADSSPLFAAFGKNVTLSRNRTLNPDGSFSGGAPWFSGIVTQVPRVGASDSEQLAYRVAGPWWYLENLVFQQPYQNVFLGFATDSHGHQTPQYGSATSSHLFLNQGGDPAILTKINNGAQIIEALNWALKPFTTAGSPPPFQIGVVTPAVDVPIEETRDITCAEVIRKMLRWSPEAVAWFDYTTSPPTFNCKGRASLPAVNLPLNGVGASSSIVVDLNVNARYDLQAPSVQIFYEISNSVNGVRSLSISKDFYPNPLPTDPVSQFRALQFTVDLQGLASNVVSATVATDPLSPTDPNWWFARHPELVPYDATANPNSNISSITFDTANLSRVPNPPLDASGNPVTDPGWTNELTQGQLASWIPYSSQRLTLKIPAHITYRNGTKPLNTTITYQCNSTNCPGGAFTSSNVTALPEPVPVGLAQAIWQAVSVLQFQGGVRLLEPECSGSLLIGSLLNITGGSDSDWASMNALVQEVEEDIDCGTTTVSFGPAKHLGAGDLTNLLRVNRFRVTLSPYTMRADGSASGNTDPLDIARSLPEKNSVTGGSPANPHVVSATPDGSGPIITHASTSADCSTVWSASGSGAPANTVKVALSDASGNNLKIQPLNVCYNGVQGKIYFLCSAFIPNS